MKSITTLFVILSFPDLLIRPIDRLSSIFEYGGVVFFLIEFCLSNKVLCKKRLVSSTKQFCVCVYIIFSVICQMDKQKENKAFRRDNYNIKINWRYTAKNRFQTVDEIFLDLIRGENLWTQTSGISWVSTSTCVCFSTISDIYLSGYGYLISRRKREILSYIQLIKIPNHFEYPTSTWHMISFSNCIIADHQCERLNAFACACESHQGLEIDVLRNDNQVWQTTERKHRISLASLFLSLYLLSLWYKGFNNLHTNTHQRTRFL